MYDILAAVVLLGIYETTGMPLWVFVVLLLLLGVSHIYYKDRGKR